MVILIFNMLFIWDVDLELCSKQGNHNATIKIKHNLQVTLILLYINKVKVKRTLANLCQKAAGINVCFFLHHMSISYQ